MPRPGSNYTVEYDDENVLVIRDIGPWSQFQTVTNNAEGVVADLWRAGRLGTAEHPKRLYYYDSEGIQDELVHDQGVFVQFAPGGPTT